MQTINEAEYNELMWKVLLDVRMTERTKCNLLYERERGREKERKGGRKKERERRQDKESTSNYAKKGRRSSRRISPKPLSRRLIVGGKGKDKLRVEKIRGTFNFYFALFEFFKNKKYALSPHMILET